MGILCRRDTGRLQAAKNMQAFDGKHFNGNEKDCDPAARDCQNERGLAGPPTVSNGKIQAASDDQASKPLHDHQVQKVPHGEGSGGILAWRSRSGISMLHRLVISASKDAHIGAQTSARRVLAVQMTVTVLPAPEMTVSASIR